MKGIERIKSFGLDEVDEFALIHNYLRNSERNKQKVINYKPLTKEKLKFLSCFLLDSIYYSMIYTIFRIAVYIIIVLINYGIFSKILRYTNSLSLDEKIEQTINIPQLIAFIISLAISFVIIKLFRNFDKKRFEKRYEKAFKKHALICNIHFRIEKNEALKKMSLVGQITGNPHFGLLSNIAGEFLKKR